MKKSVAVLLSLLAGCTPDRTVDEDGAHPVGLTDEEGRSARLPDDSEGYVPGLLGVKVGVEMRDGRAFVKADFCTDTRPTWIFNIQLQDATDRDLFGPPFCELEAKGGPITDFRMTEWEYGKELDGYAVSGKCLPLQIEHRYAARVIALQGMGGVLFELTADGAIRVVGDDC